MDLETVKSELQKLSTEQTKKTGKNYDLSMALYATGNYDAAYFAGMIAEPKKMVEADFDTWMEMVISEYLQNGLHSFV